MSTLKLQNDGCPCDVAESYTSSVITLTGQSWFHIYFVQDGIQNVSAMVKACIDPTKSMRYLLHNVRLLVVCILLSNL